MKTRVCYWYSPQGVFEEKEINYWSEISDKIPNKSFVYDPCGYSARTQYGKIENGDWCYMPYKEFPNEFKAYLLLVGAHANG